MVVMFDLKTQAGSDTRRSRERELPLISNLLHIATVFSLCNLHRDMLRINMFYPLFLFPSEKLCLESQKKCVTKLYHE